MPQHVVAVDIGTGSARAGIFDARRRAAGQGRASDRHEPAARESCRARFRRHLVGRLHCRAQGDGAVGCGAGSRSAPSASTPPARSWCATSTAARSAFPTGGERRFDTIVWLDHRALEGSRFLHGHEASRAGPLRACHVAGNGNAEADVAEEEAAGHLDEHRLSLRSRRFHDLEGDRRACALALHADGQMELSGAPGKAGWQQDFLEQIGLDDLLDTRTAAGGNACRSARVSGR